MADLTLRLFGQLDIISAGGSVAIRRRQPLALLIYLAIVGTATRDQLALLLFNECDEALARSRLRHVLHELRQGLREGGVDLRLLLVRGEQITLDRSRCAIDVADFSAAAQARSPDPAALAIYRGLLLDGFRLAAAAEFEVWLLAERERLALLRLNLLSRLVESAAADKRWADSLAFGQALVDADPLNEAAQAATLLHHAQLSHQWELGFRAARQAAARARRVAARADALAFEQIALDLLDKYGDGVQQRFAVLLDVENDAHLLGRREQQSAMLEALDACVFDSVGRAQACYRRGRYLSALARWNEALPLLQQALADGTDQELHSAAQLALGRCFGQQGNSVAAIDLAQPPEAPTMPAEPTRRAPTGLPAETTTVEGSSPSATLASSTETAAATATDPATGATPIPATAETSGFEPGDQGQQTVVNLQLVFDASGSMAERLGSETRIVAARRASEQVFATLPTGSVNLNVGFRVFGHRGDNSEAGRTESCQIVVACM